MMRRVSPEERAAYDARVAELRASSAIEDRIVGILLDATIGSKEPTAEAMYRVKAAVILAEVVRPLTVGDPCPVCGLPGLKWHPGTALQSATRIECPELWDGPLYCPTCGFMVPGTPPSPPSPPAPPAAAGA
jgi:hypothetical protein